MTLAIAIAPPASASLSWLQREARVESGAHGPAVEAEFSFTNTGETRVTITSVFTGCGCTVAMPDKDTYAPGESGVLTASYEPEGKPGTHLKHITVRTDDPDQPVLTLKLHVTEPEVVRLSEKMLTWKAGEPREPKTLRIEVAQDEPLPKLTARTTNKDLNLSLQPIEEGRVYELTITPSGSAGRIRRARVTLHVDGEEKTPAFRSISVTLPEASEPPHAK